MSKQLQLDVHQELIIDNFAGGGGASTGIEMALGRRVDVAINHDPEAVSMHLANHPETRHYCESVWEVNPREIADGRPVGLVWLSPDCKHFSKAKGGQPVEKKIRGLAWVALRWAATVQPRVIMLENVEEFVTWGPLAEGPDGKMRPCPKNKGREFNAFTNALRRHGYAVEWRELRACDFGAPTTRKRLFLIARRDGQPITWPLPTHNEHGTDGQQPWRTAAECIDWSLTCPSIFERKKPLADATLRRIARGIVRYVLEAQEPFIVTNTSGHPGAPVSDPLRTVTTAGNQMLCVPTLIQAGYGERAGQQPRVLDIGKPLGTIVAGGGKHALVAAFLAKHYTGVVGSSLKDPMATVTSVDHHSLVVALMEKFNGRTTSLQRTDRGRPTGSEAGRDDLEAGSPGLSAESYPNRTQASGVQEQSRLSDGQDGMAGKALPAGRAPRSIHGVDRPDPSRDGCQPSGRKQGQQQPEQSGASDAQREPPARPPDGPSGRIGSHHERVGHSEEVLAFLTVYYGADQDPRLEEPLHTITTRDRFGLVTAAGEDYAIADIGLRMLAPAELYRAQGFPADYIIEWGIDASGARIPLTKTAQVRMCGNSVCPPLAAALVRANVPDLAVRRIAA